MGVRGIAPDPTADSIVVGNPVVSGGANRVLYEDASQNLATEAAFTYNESTNTLTADTFAGALSGTITSGTWAAVSATTPANGTVRWVTDVGRNGSLWIYNSTDVRWRPVNGSVSLLSSALPMILPSSGSIGNNGSLTGLTALPITYASCYMYFPAAAIVAGSAAGLYYVVMSSTTAGTIFNNTYTAGLPTIPSSPTPFVTTGPGAYTQTTASDITLVSFTVLGGVMGLNGSLESLHEVSYTNSAGSKTFKAKFSSTSIASNAGTTSSAAHIYSKIANRGTASLQKYVPVGSTGFFQNGTAGTTAAIDTTSDQSLTWTAQLAAAADFLVFEQAQLRLNTP